MSKNYFHRQKKKNTQGKGVLCMMELYEAWCWGSMKLEGELQGVPGAWRSSKSDSSPLAVAGVFLNWASPFPGMPQGSPGGCPSTWADVFQGASRPYGETGTRPRGGCRLLTGAFLLTPVSGLSPHSPAWTWARPVKGKMPEALWRSFIKKKIFFWSYWPFKGIFYRYHFFF